MIIPKKHPTFNTMSDNWYSANLNYISLAVTAVHQALQDFLKSQTESPQPNYGTNTDDDSDLQPEFSAILAGLDNLAASLNPPPALEQLCNIFHLSAFERQILLLCVAQAIIPGFPALCAQAQGSPPRPYPTFSLALQIYDNKHWYALTPQAPLLRWQLIQVGNTDVLTLCPLQIDTSILHFLMGEPYQDARIGTVVETINTERIDSLQSSHEEIADQVTALLSSASVIQLVGANFTDKLQIAAFSCSQLGYPLKKMSVNHLPVDPDDLNNFLHRWEREVALTQSVLLLECKGYAEPKQQAALLDFIEQGKFPVIIVSSERQYSPSRPLITFEVPNLTYSEQISLWHLHLGSTAIENGQIEALVSQFNLSASTIETACHQFKTQSPQREAQNQLWNFCRIIARPHLDDLAQRIESKASWDDLVIPEQQQQILSDIAIHLRQRTKVYQHWGFASKGGRGLGISALFYGESGTGKTMAASVLASELHLDLYRIDLSAVISKYIGETEKNLRRIFDAAETGGVILLFDEADALFGKRSEVKDSHDRYANVEVGYLLQRMEAYQGLAVLTTNFKHSLDRAFERRIRFIIEFPLPNAFARALIWRRIFPHQMPAEDLDFQKLGQLNVSGGNIRNIAMNAAFLAADSEEPMTMKHILQATQREYLKLKKLLTDEEIRGWVIDNSLI